MRPLEEGKIWEVELRSQNMPLQLAAATWQMQRKPFRLLPNHFGARLCFTNRY